MKYDKIVLEPGMYKSGKRLSEILEEMDPSYNYIDTVLEGLDAYGRQLKRYDIKVNGDHCDTVEKFFQDKNSACLFPEYIEAKISEGYDDRISDIRRCIEIKTDLSSKDYRSARYKYNCSSDNQVIMTNDDLTNVDKVSHSLDLNYDTMRFQRINVVGSYFYYAGQALACKVINKLIDVIIDNAIESDTFYPCDNVVAPVNVLRFSVPDFVIASRSGISVADLDRCSCIYEPILCRHNIDMILLNKASAAIEMVIASGNKCGILENASKIIDKISGNMEISLNIGFNILCRDEIVIISR